MQIKGKVTILERTRRMGDLKEKKKVPERTDEEASTVSARPAVEGWLWWHSNSLRLSTQNRDQ